MKRIERSMSALYQNADIVAIQKNAEWPQSHTYPSEHQL